MPTLTLPRRPSQRLFTIADVAEMPEIVPSGPVHYELHQGRLSVMAPPGDIHGSVENKIAAYLFMYGELKGHGESRCGESGVVLQRGSLQTLYGADALFIKKQHLPVKYSREGYLETVPSIVAEVRSPSDSAKYLQEKIAAYLKAGVEVVWMLDPQKRSVTVFKPKRSSRILAGNEFLTANGIIPGFKVKVSDLFPK
jgi:Uma2 family endonuclease